jgi:hypothetical protein
MRQNLVTELANTAKFRTRSERGKVSSYRGHLGAKPSCSSRCHGREQTARPSARNQSQKIVDRRSPCLEFVLRSVFNSGSQSHCCTSESSFVDAIPRSHKLVAKINEQRFPPKHVAKLWRKRVCNGPIEIPSTFVPSDATIDQDNPYRVNGCWSSTRSLSQTEPIWSLRLRVMRSGSTLQMQPAHRQEFFLPPNRAGGVVVSSHVLQRKVSIGPKTRVALETSTKVARRPVAAREEVMITVAWLANCRRESPCNVSAPASPGRPSGPPPVVLLFSCSCGPVPAIIRPRQPGGYQRLAARTNRKVVTRPS